MITKQKVIQFPRSEEDVVITEEDNHIYLGVRINGSLGWIPVSLMSVIHDSQLLANDRERLLLLLGKEVTFNITVEDY